MLVQEKLQNREHFTEVDHRIADYILEQGAELKKETVRQIAAKLYVAPSSVIRLSRKLGYQGFNQLREDYLKEVEYLSSHFRQLDPNFPFEKGDGESVMIGKMLSLHQEILEDCRTLLTPEILKQAVDLLDKAERIFLFGSATHMGAGADFMEKMSKIGRDVCTLTHGDMAFWKALNSRENVCFVLVSYTGETVTAVQLARQLKKRGIPTIAITSYGNNSLSQACDCSLYLSTREKLIQNLGPFGTTLSLVFLFNLLYSDLFSRRYEECFRKKVSNARVYDGRHSSNPILEDDLS